VPLSDIPVSPTTQGCAFRYLRAPEGRQNVAQGDAEQALGQPPPTATSPRTGATETPPDKLIPQPPTHNIRWHNPLVDAVHVHDFTLHLRFSDGTEDELAQELDGVIFEPLKDPAYFKKFSVHPELHTITWPNGADFAPEFLYEKVRVAA